LEPKTCNLSSGESQLGASPAALKAMRSSLSEVWSYRYADDIPLRQTLAHAFHHSLTADQFLTANGSLELIDLICRALIEPGDECIICSPTLSAYAEAASRAGATLIDVPLDPRYFELNIPGLLGAINNNTRLIFLVSPNNPTGSLVTRADMDSLTRQLPARTIIICDQVYYHYVTEPGYGPAINYIKRGLPVIGLHSFSKAYGLAGMRLGYAFSTKAIIRQLRPYHRSFPINTLSMEAGMAALNDHAFIKKTVRFVARERKWLYNQFGNMGLRFWPSQANFILLRTPYEANIFAGHLEKKGLLVLEGEEFVPKGCIRVTIGTRPINKLFIKAVQELI
jgi:histidinol-phosphate aminotransferase